jgi:general secretion pathway protein E
MSVESVARFGGSPRALATSASATASIPRDLRVAREVPYAFARDHHVLVARREDGDAVGAARSVFISTATSPLALAELQRALGPVRVVEADGDALEKAIAKAYATDLSSGGGSARVVDEVDASLDLSRLMQDMPEIEDLLEAEDNAPVIRLINALFTEAAREGASDIHLEPFETHSVVRFRVDGTLRDIVRPRRQLHSALISRIKIMANLDIAEKRLPQDGRISLRVAGRPLDVRVSTLPVGNSPSQPERAVLRLLDKEAGRLDLTALGMGRETLATFDALIKQPHGIVLVTGPTGSGKTTTLYAALARIDASTTNILTVEDPIEYELPAIGQTQVNARIGMSFAAALRAILRQDPDVIMIGEIRDLETAQIAVQASLTGHLVLATLHTNDAISAATRLADMGVEPFLLSSSLLGVVAQRLVRKLCDVCKVQKEDGWHPVGCATCGHTGYQGRTGIYELLRIDDRLRDLVHDQSGEPALRDAARAAGMKNLREDGDRWIASGVTSREEVFRVTRD